jgi:hypothetical protein
MIIGFDHAVRRLAQGRRAAIFEHIDLAQMNFHASLIAYDILRPEPLA